MDTKEEFKIKLKKSFNNLEIPETLNKLIDFVFYTSPTTFFSQGFALTIDEQKIGLKTYSEDPNFYNNIFEFADADITGSSYAFWINDKETNLEYAPIVISGSDGDIHIIANNIKELLLILAADCDVYVSYDSVDYYCDDELSSVNIQLYLDWLKNEFGYKNIENPNDIVQRAKEIHQSKFNDWSEQFY